MLSAPRRRLKGPLDAADEARLSDSLAAMPEGRLKRALVQLGREVLREAAADRSAPQSPLARKGGPAPKGR